MEIHIFISLVLIFLAIIFQKSKVVTLSFFCYMWILWGWNNWNGDYEAYEYMFENSIVDTLSTVGYEKGYFLINYFFYGILGFNYHQFLASLSFIILGGICYLFLKFSNRPAIISLPYFFVFIMEYVFIRNYIVHFLLIWFFVLWFNGKEFKKIHFLLLIFVCFNIHASAIFFIIFLYLFYTRDKMLNVRKVVILSLVSSIIGILLFNIIINNLGGFLLHKIASYSTDGGISNALIGLIFLISVCLFFYLKCVDLKLLDSKKYAFIIYLINFNLLCLFFIPIFYYIPYFARSFRLILTLDLIGLGMFFPYVYSSKKIRFYSYLVIISLFVFIVVLFSKGTHEYELFPLFKSNDLIGNEYYNTNIL